MALLACSWVVVPSTQADRLLLDRDCRLLKLRLSSSVSPPQTPWSTPDSKAHWRHGSLTGQPRQTSRASSTCSIAGPVVPMGKKSSGSLWRQAASSCQLAPARADTSPRGFGSAGARDSWAFSRARADPAFGLGRGAVVTGEPPLQPGAGMEGHGLPMTGSGD